MLLLTPYLQHYPWGDVHQIPNFLGAESTGEPVAEAWFGAHPSGPSGVVSAPSQCPDSMAPADATSPDATSIGAPRSRAKFTHMTRTSACASHSQPSQTLGEVIAEDPSRVLGEDVVARFGRTLPYLLKLIAPAKPLSLQVHPNRDQARAGYIREEAAALAGEAAESSGEATGATRCYPDANHKPELVYALTTFEAVSGFRAPRRAAELFEGLAAPLASDMLVRLRAEPNAIGVRAAFALLLEEAEPASVAEVAAQCAERLAAGTSPSRRTDAIVARLAAEYPGDPGAVAALLLNPVTLQPGEAMFIPAGVVHAYLHGFGVEVMANSDNVLRAGLTSKHIDIAELLDTVDPLAAPPIRIAPEMVDESTGVFYAPVDDFELSIARFAGDGDQRLLGRGPRIVLALTAGLTLVCGDQQLPLAQGQAAFISAEEERVFTRGAGIIVQADVP